MSEEEEVTFKQKYKDGYKTRKLNGKRADNRKAKPGHVGRTYCIGDLGPRESLFVREYLIHGNAKKAAREAGYSRPQSGNNLLNKKIVAAVIREEQLKRMKKYDITADRVLREVAAIAFTNLSDVVDWGPNGIKLKDSQELDKMVKKAVAEVSETVTGKSTTTKVKMHDKLAALEKLMKHLGLYPRETEDNKKKKVDPLKLMFDAIIASREQQAEDDEDKPKVVKKKSKKVVEPEPDEDDEDDD